MLILKNISRIYKPRRGVPVKALDDISLKIADTGMVFILGKSGSGKSTFLNVVGGLDKYDSGELIVKDKSTLNFNQNDFDSYRNTMIGFIFQEYNVLDEFTVAQNIGLALELQGIKATNERIDEILEAVDLVGYGRRKPNELSGGQKQRVAIARALVKNPEIIMADEPTGALDSETGLQILETLKKLSKTRLVIVVSHDREFANKYGDRIIEFMDGKIISDVTKEVSKVDLKQKVFIEDEKLVLQAGYKLTELDLRLINDYLIHNKRDLIVDKRDKNTRYVETDESKLSLSKEDYKPIKSKLPFKSSLKIGASSLKHKQVRLFISILLASIAFALFGLSDTMASYNKTRALKESIEESTLEQYSINKVANTKTNWGVNKRDIGMFQTDIDELNTKFPSSKFIGIYKETDGYLTFQNNLYEQLKPIDQIVYKTDFTGFTSLTTDVLNNSPLELVAGRIPATTKEIVISNHTFNYFKKFGLRDPLTGDKVIISDHSQLLNEDIDINNVKYKVVGVVNTFEKIEDFIAKANTATSNDQWILMNEVNNYYENRFDLVIFTHPDHLGEFFDESADISTNNIGANITLSDQDLDSIWFSTINNAKNLSANNIVYYSGLNSLGNNDFVLPFGKLINLDYSIISDLNTELETYSNNINYNTVKQVLQDAAIYYESGDPVNDEINNRYQFFANFYSLDYDHQYEYTRGIPTFDVALKTAATTYFATKPAKVYNFNYDNYYNEDDNFEVELKLAGIYFDDKYDRYKQNETVYFSDFIINKLNLVEEGPFVKAISFDIENEALLDQIIKYHFDDASETTFKFNNDITASLDYINGFVEDLSSMFIYVGIGFAVFASLMLLNFISISVSYKKQEIGILRAIGARGKDVLGIFTKESMIIAIINYVLAVTFTIVAVTFINQTFKDTLNMQIKILSFGIRQIVLILAVDLVVAFLSSALPVIKTARKRPIDAIRNK